MYRVADISFEAKDCGSVFFARAEKYISNDSEPEFLLTVTDEDLARETAFSGLDPDGVRYMLSGVKFYFELIKRGGMMLHASAVVKDGKAYLFSGPSGMGKSTHTRNWLALFPDAYILNDDKPAIKLTEEGFFVYGTPWSGKHDISRNEGVPLGGIAFIERSSYDRIEPMGAKEAAAGLLAGTVRRVSRERMEELLTTVDLLVKRGGIYRLGCTMDVSSAELAHRVMSGSCV